MRVISGYCLGLTCLLSFTCQMHEYEDKTSTHSLWLLHILHNFDSGGLCFSRHGGGGSTVGLDDLRGLFQP